VVQYSQFGQHPQHEENIGLVQEGEVQTRPEGMDATRSGVIGLEQGMTLQQEGQAALDGRFSLGRTMSGRQSRQPPQGPGRALGTR